MVQRAIKSEEDCIILEMLFAVFSITMSLKLAVAMVCPSPASVAAVVLQVMWPCCPTCHSVPKVPAETESKLG